MCVQSRSGKTRDIIIDQFATSVLSSQHLELRANSGRPRIRIMWTWSRAVYKLFFFKNIFYEFQYRILRGIQYNTAEKRREDYWANQRTINIYNKLTHIQSVQEENLLIWNVNHTISGFKYFWPKFGFMSNCKEPYRRSATVWNKLTAYAQT